MTPAFPRCRLSREVSSAASRQECVPLELMSGQDASPLACAREETHMYKPPSAKHASIAWGQTVEQF